MGRDSAEEVEMERVTVRIVDESERMKEEIVGVGGAEERVIRKRKGGAVEEDRGEGEEELKTSQFEESQGGWLETDPETTQSFKRRQQVMRRRIYFLNYSISWSFYKYFLRAAKYSLRVGGNKVARKLGKVLFLLTIQLVFWKLENITIIVFANILCEDLA